MEGWKCCRKVTGSSCIHRNDCPVSWWNMATRSVAKVCRTASSWIQLKTGGMCLFIKWMAKITRFASRHEYVSHLTIQPDFGGTRGNMVTRAELVTLSDYCGHPEIPINGHVQWMTNDITACYSCDQGFRLNANSQIRRCIQGSWDGPEPTCMTFLQVKWI